MSDALQAWNVSDKNAAVEALLSCCCSSQWAEGLTAMRPYASAQKLFEASDLVWASMREPDWLEAFRAHPKIGERKAAATSAQSATWSSQEQASVSNAAEQVLIRLTELNTLYEARFGFTYIVCATGKNAEEMLAILEKRLGSERDSELLEAAEQQRQITQIRLRKWLQS